MCLWTPAGGSSIKEVPQSTEYDIEVEVEQEGGGEDNWTRLLNAPSVSTFGVEYSVVNLYRARNVIQTHMCSTIPAQISCQ